MQERKTDVRKGIRCQEGKHMNERRTDARKKFVWKEYNVRRENKCMKVKHVKTKTYVRKENRCKKEKNRYNKRKSL